MDGNHLFKFSSREGESGYKERKKRAVHLNNVQPLADMITGFLYTEKPTRKNTDAQNYLLESVDGKGKSFDSFMYQIAVNSLMQTTGILVESPQFDPSLIRTEADRKQYNANPYCCRYELWKIRDFYPDTGPLEWILLDNSYIDSVNPFKKPEEINIYRLWTTEFYQDIRKIKTITGQYEYQIDNEVYHNIGEVPFIFANWRNKDNCRIADTIFEDIAYFDQAIYNAMSLLDEMLASGTFKFLAYPTSTGDVPEELTNGFTNYAVIPYNGSAGKPEFIGANMNEIAPFLQVMDFYITAIKRKLGLDSDLNKDYQQSGVAKNFDFKKTRALLISGAQEMEKVEKEIFRFAALWENKDTDIEIEYYTDFLGEEMISKLTRLYQLLDMPYQQLKKTVSKKIVELNLDRDIDEDEMETILNDIDGYEPMPPPVNVKNLIKLEKETVNDGNTEDRQ